MADEEQFSLCWNNFNSNLSAGFHESLCRGDLVDVTLAAEGQLVKAHRLVLSVCSPYFRKMFTQMPPNQHAFVFLKDVSHAALKDLIQFMYCGEVNVKQDALPAFISTAEALQIKGLTETGETTTAAAQQSPSKPTTPAPSNAASTITSPRSRMQRNVSRTSYKLESESETDEKQVSGGQKRVQQRSVTPQATPVAKRPKNNDPLEASESTTHILTTASDTKSMGEPEFIDLPIETIPTKSEPDYGDDTGDVEPVEQETGYVEDDSYGEMKYDESYFTENDDAKPGASGFTETYGGAEGDTSVTEAQANEQAKLIEKPVFRYVNNKKGGQNLVISEYTYRREATFKTSTNWICIHGNDRDSSDEIQGTAIFSHTTRGREQLIFCGQPFIFEKTLSLPNGNEKKLWRCNQWWNQKCRARVFTIDNLVTTLNKYHTHEEIVRRKKRANKTKIKIKKSKKKTRENVVDDGGGDDDDDDDDDDEDPVSVTDDCTYYIKSNEKDDSKTVTGYHIYSTKK